MLVLIRKGTSLRLQHDVSIQISINFVKTFLRISLIRNIPLAWILARVFAYLPPFYFPDSGLYLLKAFDFYFDLFWMGEDKRWTRGPWTPSLDRVHGPLSWTGSMDPLSWTRSMDSFFYFYKKVLHQVHGHSKTEIVRKKDFTRSCRPMLTIDHKYLVVLTWRTLCLYMCSRKTVKLS